MPKNNKTQIPTFVSVADMRPVAEHFHDLAMFAREVMVGFDERGERALNRDGSTVLEQLPALLAPLPPCQYQTTITSKPVSVVAQGARNAVPHSSSKFTRVRDCVLVLYAFCPECAGFRWRFDNCKPLIGYKIIRRSGL
jgi:hypothetical protein